MQKLKRLFGEINLTWIKLIIFSIIAGAYTALMALLPLAKDTSFADITISFEVWILFGILIIMNSKSALDSGLKCFVFFLISQPLVYLIQDAINHSNLFMTYYRFWILWTIATFPMGFIGYFMKKDKWWGLFILSPMLLFLGAHYSGFLNATRFYFPYHLLSTLFCLVVMIICPLCIFESKKIKTAGFIISILIIISMSFVAVTNYKTYDTTILTSDSEKDIGFDDSYKAYLENDKYGSLDINYDEDLEAYKIDAKFKRAGKTNLVLEDKEGNKTKYKITIKRNSYKIKKQ